MFKFLAGQWSEFITHLHILPPFGWWMVLTLVPAHNDWEDKNLIHWHVDYICMKVLHCQSVEGLYSAVGLGGRICSASSVSLHLAFMHFFLYRITLRSLMMHVDDSSKERLRENGLHFKTGVEPHSWEDHLCPSTACHRCWSSAKPERKPSQTLPSVYISLGIMPCISSSLFPAHPVADHRQHMALNMQWWTINLNLNLNQSFSSHANLLKVWRWS